MSAAESHPALLSREQKAIIRIAYHTGQNMLIFGDAGSGKSRLIQGLKQFYWKRHKEVLLTAPTGIAASNIHGCTLHSLLGLAPTFQESSTQLLQSSISKEKRDLIRGCAAIVVDEASMVRVDLFDMLNAVLQAIMGNNRPFGGKQIILVGDFSQLAPFAEDRLERTELMNRYGGYWLFMSPLFSQVRWLTAELTENFRQVDPEQQAILKRFRTGTVDQETLDKVNARCVREAPEDHPFPILCSTRKEVSDENSYRYDKLDASTEHVYTCKYSKALKDFGVEQTIRLRIGAKVMMACNDSGKRWVNGTVGTVVGLRDDCIFVEINGVVHQVDKVEFCRYKYTRGKNGELIHQPYEVTNQYPVRLGWAITIHKAQGMTLDGAYLAKKGRAFTTAQIYVALSRVRNLDNLWLLKPLVLEEIMTDRRALKVMNDAIAEEKDRGYLRALISGMDVYGHLTDMICSEIQSGKERILIRGAGASMVGILLGSRNRWLQIVCDETVPQYMECFRNYMSRYRTVNISLAGTTEANALYDIAADLDSLVHVPVVQYADGRNNWPESYTRLVNGYIDCLESKACLILCESTCNEDRIRRFTGMVTACQLNGFVKGAEPKKRNCVVQDVCEEYSWQILYMPERTDPLEGIW